MFYVHGHQVHFAEPKSFDPLIYQVLAWVIKEKKSSSAFFRSQQTDTLMKMCIVIKCILQSPRVLTL